MAEKLSSEKHHTARTAVVEADSVKANVAVLLSPDDLVREHVGGFVNFIREHAVVGLAVGFVIGTQVQSVVKQLIASFIDPLTKLFIGNTLSTATLTVRWNGRDAAFGWGAFVYALIDFLVILGVMYLVVKVFKFDKLDKPSGP